MMIEMLSGKILFKQPGKVVIDCGGVGYSASISSFAYSALGNMGDKQVLHTVMKVREDDISLFGFAELKEKELFLILSSVSGIGSKTAIQLLSEIKYDRLLNAIVTKDATLISQAHGVGKKTAQKIVFELKDKFGKGGEDFSDDGFASINGSSSEAVAALVSLGYKNADAVSAVSSVLKNESADISAQEIIKAVLQKRMKK